MNCCFEDCVEFDACVGRTPPGSACSREFGALRKPEHRCDRRRWRSDNYLEMRERVADPKFQLQHALALELERRFPQRFIPRYSMVMFHHEIPYRTALERGAVQTQLLAELTGRRSRRLDGRRLRAGGARNRRQTAAYLLMLTGAMRSRVMKL